VQRKKGGFPSAPHQRDYKEHISMASSANPSFSTKKYQGSFSNVCDQIKFQVALFSSTPSSTLIFLPFFCSVQDVLLQLQKLFCVLMLELKKLSLDGSSQPEKKLEGCYKRITHLGQLLPPIHLKKIFILL